MEDLRTLLRISARHKLKLLAVALITGVVMFFTGGARLEFVSVSPDRTYRLEYYTARRYQHLLNWQMELPSFVRLYRNTDNQYFGESNVADFFAGEGESFWMVDVNGRVRVGHDILFEGVPPVSPSGQVLPIPTVSGKTPSDDSSGTIDR